MRDEFIHQAFRLCGVKRKITRLNNRKSTGFDSVDGQEEFAIPAANI